MYLQAPAAGVNKVFLCIYRLLQQVLTRFEAEGGGHLLVATLCLLEVSATGLLESELLYILADEENVMPGSVQEKGNVFHLIHIISSVYFANYGQNIHNTIRMWSFLNSCDQIVIFQTFHWGFSRETKPKKVHY